MEWFWTGFWAGLGVVSGISVFYTIILALFFFSTFVYMLFTK